MVGVSASFGVLLMGIYWFAHMDCAPQKIAQKNWQ
jgi:hypothetical protein